MTIKTVNCKYGKAFIGGMSRVDDYCGVLVDKNGKVSHWVVDPEDTEIYTQHLREKFTSGGKTYYLMPEKMMHPSKNKYFVPTLPEFITLLLQAKPAKPGELMSPEESLKRATERGIASFLALGEETKRRVEMGDIDPDKDIEAMVQARIAAAASGLIDPEAAAQTRTQQTDTLSKFSKGLCDALIAHNSQLQRVNTTPDNKQGRQ